MHEESMTPFYKKPSFWLALLVAVGALLIYCHLPVEYPLRIEPGTTYLTGPLNNDGLVNYVAALNDSAGRGVAEEDNAARLLILAAGPDPEIDPMAEALGLTEPVETPFVKITDFVTDEEARKQIFKELDLVFKGSFRREDFPLIGDWVEANEQPLAMVAEASRRTKYFLPLVSPSRPPTLMDVSTAHMNLFHDMARALTARAMLRLEGGENGSALEDLLTVHRLARLFCLSPMLIDRVLGLTVETMACHGDRAAACSGRLDSEESKGALAALEALPPLPDFARVFDECERFMALDSVSMLYSGKQPAGMEEDQAQDTEYLSTFDWNAIMATLNSYYDRIRDAFGEKDRRAVREALGAVDREVEERAERVKALKPWKLILMRLLGRLFHDTMNRIMTDMMVTLMIKPTAMLSDFGDALRMRFDLSRLVYALAAYHRDRGAYPETLDALAPGYLAKVPVDLFTGEALRYERNGDGFRAYSLGPDGKDDQGLDEGEISTGDIAVSTG
jgi:hypothetical protein